MTRDGFYSVVQHNADDTMVQVRARVRDDLVRLVDALDRYEVRTLASGTLNLVRMPDADYLWRITMPRVWWSIYLTHAVGQIDYTSHAKEVMADGHPDHRFRYAALLDVWEALAALQESEPYRGVGPVESVTL